MAEVRVGDVIDDHCSRCRMTANHSVVAMIGEEIKKVRCRTCNHEHDYRHGKGNQKKQKKLSAYEQVLASVLSGKTMETQPKTVEPPASRPPHTSLRGRSGTGRPRSTR